MVVRLGTNSCDCLGNWRRKSRVGFSDRTHPWRRVLLQANPPKPVRRGNRTAIRAQFNQPIRQHTTIAHQPHLLVPQYSEDNIAETIRSIAEGRVFLRDAQRGWNISRPTLNDRTNGSRSRRDAHAHEMITTEQQEEDLAE
jgi:hypothetical protein